MEYVHPRPHPHVRPRVWRQLAAALALGACTRTGVPITSTPLGTQAQPERTLAPLGSPTAQVSPGPSAQFVYAVAWTPADGLLPVRQPAGISGTVVEQLPADQRGLRLTGKSTLLGSSLWVEIERPSGGTGWVNASNLTEDVSPERFCNDPQVAALLDRFREAVTAGDGHALVEIVDPRRGLGVRHDWWNIEVAFPVSVVADLFDSSVEVDWGMPRNSLAPIHGSFRELVAPDLQRVFQAQSQTACDRLLLGESAQPAAWPAEYANLNYHVFYDPAPTPAPRFNWRAWAVGIEYVDGRPYLALLVPYRGEI